MSSSVSESCSSCRCSETATVGGTRGLSSTIARHLESQLFKAPERSIRRCLTAMTSVWSTTITAIAVVGSVIAWSSLSRDPPSTLSHEATVRACSIVSNGAATLSWSANDDYVDAPCSSNQTSRSCLDFSNWDSSASFQKIGYLWQKTASCPIAAIIAVRQNCHEGFQLDYASYWHRLACVT